MKTIKIDIVKVLYWLSLIILVIMLAWWALGDSPTSGQISAAVGIAGISVGYRESRRTRRLLVGIKWDIREQEKRQTTLLNKIYKAK